MLATWKEPPQDRVVFGAMSEAIGVLLTFTTYGTHVHGAETGSVSRSHRAWAPTVPSNETWQVQARRLMAWPEFRLSPRDRALVVKCVVNACACHAWQLFCVHARTNHVHAVLQADAPADRALSEGPRYFRAKGASSRPQSVLDQTRQYAIPLEPRVFDGSLGLRHESARASDGIVGERIDYVKLQSLRSWLRLPGIETTGIVYR
jgi:hypothetical protein